MDGIGEDYVEWGSLAPEGKGQMCYLISGYKPQVFRYKSDSHPSMKTVLFATDGDHYRTLHQSNQTEESKWPRGTQFQLICLQHIEEGVKRLRVRETKCLLRDYVSWKCQRRLHAWSLNKMAAWTRTGMLPWGKKNLWSPTLGQRSTGNSGMLRAREILFPRKEHPDWFSNTEWSALQLYAYK